MAVKRLLFYVTGHGFGHGVRIAEVMRCLNRMRPEWQLDVRTTASSWLFDDIAHNQVRVLSAEVDTGAIESIDSLRIDRHRTVEVAAAFLQRRQQVIDQEVEWLNSNPSAAIIADIPYLAGNIADRVGIPAIGISNFLWDFIYEPLLEGDVRSAEILDAIRVGYSKMTVLRLPFGHAMPHVREVIDVPLVTRQRSAAVTEIRRRLKLDAGDSRPIVYFGMRFDLTPQVLTRAALSMPDFLLVYFGETVPGLPENTRSVLFDGDLSFADVISQCEAVVSKPGYGMFAACAANRVKILYPPRIGFREDTMLLSEIRRYTAARELPWTDFESGNWGDHVERLHAQPLPAETMEANGGDACAQFIVSRLE